MILGTGTMDIKPLDGLVYFHVTELSGKRIAFAKTIREHRSMFGYPKNRKTYCGVVTRNKNGLNFIYRYNNKEHTLKLPKNFRLEEYLCQ